MENEKSTGNKYTVKDAAIIGIFCAVMFVVFMVYSTLTGASLFYSMIFNAAGAALILAPFYIYMCMKVGKHGPALVYNIMWAIIAGLMMGPFMIPWFLGGGIIAELSMCGKNAYHDIKRVSISWVITALVRAAHGMSEIWFFRDAFLATGVSEQQVQVQTQYYTDPKYVLLSLAVTAILAVLGCMISNKLIVKHFRKSGAIKVLTMSLVAVLTSDILIYTLLGVLSVYLIIQGFGRQTIKYLIVCGVFIVLRLISGGQGITILMPEMFLFMVLRILMMVMAAQPVIGMSPGEVVAVFKKIHAPDGIALPVTFMLRFFPTVRSEFADVFAALRLRKLLSWKHPLDAMEYIVTPVIFRSSRIAEELAASAESRGISNPGKHTCRRKIEFQKRDWIMSVIAVCVTALYFVLERTVA